MTIPIRVGDIVNRTGDPRPWRVVDVYPELGFARLEFAGEAWVKSATADLDQLLAVSSQQSAVSHQEFLTADRCPLTADC
jgi:hypothetical protein